MNNSRKTTLSLRRWRRCSIGVKAMRGRMRAQATRMKIQRLLERIGKR